MRLRAVEHRHRLPERLKLALIRVVSGRRVPDVVKTLLYRPEFFGRAMCEWTQAVMARAPAWGGGRGGLVFPPPRPGGRGWGGPPAGGGGGGGWGGGSEGGGVWGGGET